MHGEALLRHISDNRTGFEYISYSTWHKITLQVNEHLLRDRCIQNHAKDLK